MKHGLLRRRTAMAYAVVGALWILATDWLVDLIVPPGTTELPVQTIKGLLFVAGSTLLVSVLIRLAERMSREGEQEVGRAWDRAEQADAHRTALVEALPHAVMSVDLEGNLRTWNDAAERLFGWSSDEVLGGPPPFVPEESESEFRRLLSRVRSGEPLTGLELIRIHKDGRRIPVTLGAAPVTDREGEIIGIVAVMDDISERREMEGRARRLERMRAQAEAAARLGSWEMDVGSGEIHWSPGLYRLFGLDADRPPPSFAEHVKLFQVGDFERLEAAVQRAVEEGEPYSMEIRARTADGEWYRGLAEGRAETGADGRVVRLYGSFQDIQERSERALERERLLRAIEQIQEAVVITDMDGDIVYVNPAFEEKTGYARNEVLGGNPRMLKSGEHGPDFYRELWETISSGRAWKGRIVNSKKDGTRIVEDTTISPVRDRSGEISHFVAVKHDVTHQLQLEERLKRSQRLESVGRLAGGVAHDFNNVLAIIRGYAESALGQTEKGTALHSDIAEILSASQRSSDLVGQLLSLSGQQISKVRTVDLNQEVEERLPGLRGLLGEHIQLRWKPCDDAVEVRVDPGQLDQVLSNVLTNAREAIGEVGDVTVETAVVEVDGEDADPVQAQSVSGPEVFGVLSVTDSGAGMDRETRERVFEPFFTTKENGEGMGLGLATVYGIVRQHNGRVHVSSERGEGTTVRIYLPRRDPRPAEPASSAPSATEAAAPDLEELTVLVVEDEPALLRLTRRLIERLGCEVMVAESPERALEHSRDHDGEIDLLVTDVMMPGMNGRELVRAIQRERPGIRHLYMSGYSAEVIADRGVLREGVNFLQKPFSAADLIRAITRAVTDDPDRHQIGSRDST